MEIRPFITSLNFSPQHIARDSTAAIVDRALHLVPVPASCPENKKTGKRASVKQSREDAFVSATTSKHSAV